MRRIKEVLRLYHELVVDSERSPAACGSKLGASSLHDPDHFRHNPNTSVAALRLLIGIAKLLIAFTENR